MNDENRINWNEVQAYLKAANVTEATNMGIYTNPMPQHQGDKSLLRDLHRYKLIQGLLLMKE
ncbi:UNVERIFIED_CONTAM: hypothetical protein Sangu_3190000 [Sesamum angustifolium]|uniref:Uncharacterized protein n=2 Tax=Sesamum TaxID=4181 RepID=A0AAW2S4L4_9LAMI